MGRNRRKEEKDNSKWSEGSDAKRECPLESGACGAAPISGETRVDRPEDKDLRCQYVNDIGIMPNENDTPRVEPDTIPGPAQIEFVDSKVVVELLVPQSDHNVLATGFQDYVEAIRPREVATPGYDENDVCALAFNARSGRAYVNQLLRALRYARARLRHGYSEIRCAHLVGSLDTNASYTDGNGQVWYDLFDDIDWPDIHNDLYAAVKDFEENVMYFDLPYISRDDEMFSKIYADSCQSSALFAFMILQLPKFQIDTTVPKVYADKNNSGYIQCGFLNPTAVTNVAALKNQLTTAIGVIRTFTAMFRTPVAMLIRRDAALAKGMRPQDNPYAVCIPFMNEFYGDGKGHLTSPSSIEPSPFNVKGSWGNKLSCATPLYVRSYHCRSECEVNFSTLQTGNKITCTEGVTWDYQSSPSCDQRAFKINTFGVCLDRESRSKCTDLVTPATTKYTGGTSHVMEFTMQEQRGVVVMDIQSSLVSSVRNSTARYHSDAYMMSESASTNQTNATTGILTAAFWRMKTEQLPEATFKFTPESTTQLASADLLRFVRSDDPDWLRRRLVRAINSDAARDLFLIKELRPALACGESRISDYTK